MVIILSDVCGEKLRRGWQRLRLPKALLVVAVRTPGGALPLLQSDRPRQQLKTAAHIRGRLSNYSATFPPELCHKKSANKNRMSEVNGAAALVKAEGGQRSASRKNSADCRGMQSNGLFPCRPGQSRLVSGFHG
jgi:hypothetical protein